MNTASIYNYSEDRKFCIYCGTPNPINSKFCIKCGANFAAADNFESSDTLQDTNHNQLNHCIKCMRPIKNGQMCSCGFDPRNYIVEAYHLIPGTILKDRYYIGSVIGEGGFGITYTGLDIVLDRKIAIKELFLSSYSNRINTVSMDVTVSTGNKALIYSKCLDRFFDEGRVMAKFGGSEGMVTINDFFKLNNTAYIIMEFVEGENLKDYCHKHGVLDYDSLLSILMPVLDVLELIHNENYIHRDLSPDNIMITPNGRGKLLDFGAARNFAFEEDKTLSVILKHGYAPIEQYSSKGHSGPWSDVYALCATMYFCLTGVTPSQAYDRMIADDIRPIHELVPSCPIQYSNAIMKGLSVEWNNRYQSIKDLRNALCPIEKPVMIWYDREKVVRPGDRTEIIRDDIEEVIRSDDKTEILRDDIEKVIRSDDKTEILRDDINQPIYLDDANKKITQGEPDNIKGNSESTQAANNVRTRSNSHFSTGFMRIIFVATATIIVLAITVAIGYIAFDKYSTKVTDEFIEEFCDGVEFGDSFEEIKKSNKNNNLLDCNSNESKGAVFLSYKREYNGVPIIATYYFKEGLYEIVYTASNDDEKSNLKDSMYNTVNSLLNICSYYHYSKNGNYQWIFKTRNSDIFIICNHNTNDHVCTIALEYTYDDDITSYFFN